MSPSSPSTLATIPYSSSSSSSPSASATDTLSTPPSSNPSSPLSLFDKSNQFKAQPKKVLVNSLVCTTSVLLNTLWHEFNPTSPQQSLDSLNTFIISILRRSKSSNLTLQVALYYLVRLSDSIRNLKLAKLHSKNTSSPRTNDVLFCKKRTFLTCLILASKFLQDRNYSMKSWGLMSGLKPAELVKNETMVLQHMDYNLFVKADMFNRWSTIISYFVFLSSRSLSEQSVAIDATTILSNDSAHLLSEISSQWRLLIGHLDPKHKLCKSINYVDLLVEHHKKLNSALHIQAC